MCVVLKRDARPANAARLPHPLARRGRLLPARRGRAVMGRAPPPPRAAGGGPGGVGVGADLSEVGLQRAVVVLGARVAQGLRARPQSTDCFTALALGTFAGRTESVRMLLSAKAEPDARDKFGETAHARATSAGKP